jgi:hypothetical protein
MRIITFMKMINCNGWAPRNKVPYECIAPIPITNPLIANHISLYDSFYDYNAGGVAWVYHNLFGPTITYHYFYEED